MRCLCVCEHSTVCAPVPKPGELEVLMTAHLAGRRRQTWKCKHELTHMSLSVCVPECVCASGCVCVRVCVCLCVYGMVW